MASVPRDKYANETAKRKNAEATIAAAAIGLPDGWQYRLTDPRSEFTAPDGNKHSTASEMLSVLGEIVMRPVSAILWKAKAESMGFTCATEFGLPVGWTVQIYARSKCSYNPEGIKYTSYDTALLAAGINPQGKVKKRSAKMAAVYELYHTKKSL